MESSLSVKEYCPFLPCELPLVPFCLVVIIGTSLGHYVDLKTGRLRNTVLSSVCSFRDGIRLRFHINGRITLNGRTSPVTIGKIYLHLLRDTPFCYGTIQSECHQHAFS